MANNANKRNKLKDLKICLICAVKTKEQLLEFCGLTLHQTMSINDFNITRVVGGWIYESLNEINEVITSVFVPYDKTPLFTDDIDNSTEFDCMVEIAKDEINAQIKSLEEEIKKLEEGE